MSSYIIHSTWHVYILKSFVEVKENGGEDEYRLEIPGV